MDPVMRRAALTGAGAHLVYGGLDVLLAVTAFCVFWRAGMAMIADERIGVDMEDDDIDITRRLERIGRRARDEHAAEDEAQDRTTDKQGAGAALAEDDGPVKTTGSTATAADGEPGMVPRIPRIDNLCAEIALPIGFLDPRACADAMMAFHAPETRTLAAFRRARTEASHGLAWAAEVHAGETMVETMSRVIASGMPAPGTVAVVQQPGLDQMRAEFDALPPAERADEIERHLWAMGDAKRVRTRFSQLLSAMGIG